LRLRKKAEADDGDGRLNTGNLGEGVFNILRRFCRALQRGALRELQIDEGVALVFGGEEAAGETSTDKEHARTKDKDDDDGDAGLADEPA
jgi:hypothetical protein